MHRYNIGQRRNIARHSMQDIAAIVAAEAVIAVKP